MSTLLDAPVKLVPIEQLVEHPQNPRRGDVDATVASIRKNGFYGTVVRQKSTGYILVGNHRTRAARIVGTIPKLPTQTIDVDDEQAARIMAADNRTSDLATYDDAALAELLRGLSEGDGLDGSGFDDAAYEELLASLAEEEEEDSDRAPTTGELLALADVTWGEPTHQVTHGDVWTVGRHTLVVAKLHTEHHLWRTHLDTNVVFAPYPEPYLTGSEVAQSSPLLLVQPNKFLAGHLLDKHASLFPDEQIVKQ